MVLFPMTLIDPTYPQTTPFSTFCIVFRIFVMSEVRDFKFAMAAGRGKQGACTPGGTTQGAAFRGAKKD